MSSKQWLVSKQCCYYWHYELNFHNIKQWCTPKPETVLVGGTLGTVKEELRKACVLDQKCSIKSYITVKISTHASNQH